MNNDTAIQLVIEGVYKDTQVTIDEGMIDAQWKWIIEPTQADINKQIRRIEDAIRHSAIGRVIEDRRHERAIVAEAVFKKRCFDTWTRLAKKSGLLR